MKRASLLLVIGLLLAAAPVQADALDDAAECAFPPCGYILPQMDIEIEDKQLCGAAYIIYEDTIPEDCYDMLEDGESRVFAAKLKWFWEMSEDGTYPKETGTDIYVTFSGTATNPKWLTAEVTGPDMVDGQFVITDADLVSPDYITVRPNAQGNDAVYFWYEKDIEITFTRDGEPTAKEVAKLEDSLAIQKFFLKAKSSESGPRFKEAFAVEEFRFNTCGASDIAPRVSLCEASAGVDSTEDRGAPGLPLLGLLAALGAALVARRR